MPCEWLKGPNGSTVHIRTSGQRKKPCPFCKVGFISKLCDYPVGEGKTCDAAMCAACTRTIGRQDTPIGHGFVRPNDTIDVCPIHRGMPFPQQPSPTPPSA